MPMHCTELFQSSLNRTVNCPSAAKFLLSIFTRFSNQIQPSFAAQEWYASFISIIFGCLDEEALLKLICLARCYFIDWGKATCTSLFNVSDRRKDNLTTQRQIVSYGSRWLFNVHSWFWAAYLMIFVTWHILILLQCYTWLHLQMSCLLEWICRSVFILIWIGIISSRMSSLRHFFPLLFFHTSLHTEARYTRTTKFNFVSIAHCKTFTPRKTLSISLILSLDFFYTIFNFSISTLLTYTLAHDQHMNTYTHTNVCRSAHNFRHMDRVWGLCWPIGHSRSPVNTEHPRTYRTKGYAPHHHLARKMASVAQ